MNTRGDVQLPTIRDVARMASVSVGTASQALSGRGRVSEDARLRVLKAAEALGYRPDPGRSPKRPQLALCMRVGEAANTQVGFLYRIVSSAMAEAADLGYDLLVRSMPETVNHLDPWGFGDGVAGTIVYTLNALPDDRIASEGGNGRPIVLLGQDMPGVSCVSIDNRRAMELVVGYLFSMGHRRIAYIGPESPCLDGVLRLEGYKAAMERMGLNPFHAPSVPTVMGRTDGSTAYACFDDNTAVAVISALAVSGALVPGDASVIGFGQVPELAPAFPGLATVAHPVEEHARAAVRLVHDTLRGACTAETHVTLGCRIVDGGTVSPPQGK